MTDPFDILAAEYRPMVLAYLRAMVRDAHLAEDLTQETMSAAHQSLGKFEPGGNFGKKFEALGFEAGSRVKVWVMDVDAARQPPGGDTANQIRMGLPLRIAGRGWRGGAFCACARREPRVRRELPARWRPAAARAGPCGGPAALQPGAQRLRSTLGHRQGRHLQPGL